MSIRPPYAVLIRRVLRLRYAALIRVVDTSGGPASLALPLWYIVRIGIPVKLWFSPELRFSSKESDEITRFVIEDAFAACVRL